MTDPKIPVIQYAPYVANLPDGGQILVQIFIDDTGVLDSVDLAFRDHPFDSWSPPIRTRKG
jgi:hypothetical protein